MSRWSLLLLALTLPLACGDKDEPAADDDEEEPFDPLAAESSCDYLCDSLCEHASGITGEALSNAECREMCEEAPGAGSECRDCWVWMNEQIWDTYGVMADCYCVTKPEAANPYAEDCAEIIDEYYGGDSSTLEQECAEGCVEP